MYFCVYRDLTKRVCIAGGNRLLIESPSEPKWSPKGILLLYLYVDLIIVKMLSIGMVQ
jgi:hypothetical protein